MSKGHFSEKQLEFYESVPVYPEFTSKSFRKAQITISIYAPLCEDDRGRVSFISQEAKDRFLKTYRKEYAV